MSDQRMVVRLRVASSERAAGTTVWLLTRGEIPPSVLR
jgi:hypothetical protein